MPVVQRCGSCRFWVAAGGETVPTCHRDPFSVYIAFAMQFSNKTAALRDPIFKAGGIRMHTEDNWCGEWAERPLA